MNKALLLVAVLSAGWAQGMRANPVEFLIPPSETLLAVCQENYDVSAATGDWPGAFEYTMNLRLGDGDDDPFSPTSRYLSGALVTPVVGNVAEACGEAAPRVLPLPAAAELDRYLTVRVEGGADERTEAEGWTAALVLRDAQGTELARILPAEEYRGDPRAWERRCEAGTCWWRGRNHHFFELGELVSAQRAAITAAARLELVVTRGDKVDVYPLAPGR